MQEFKHYLNAKHEESPALAEAILGTFEALGRGSESARDAQKALAANDAEAPGGEGEVWVGRNEAGAPGSAVVEASEVERGAFEAFEARSAHAEAERAERAERAELARWADPVFRLLAAGDESGHLTAKELIRAFQAEEGEPKFEAARHARDWIREMDQVDHDKMVST